MKILAFTDSHANSQAHAILRARAKTADIILCAGDISLFGMSLLESLEEMNSWGKPVFLIHGNHEDEDLLVDVNEQYANVHFIHKREVTVGDVKIWGYGGGGFARRDLELESYSEQFEPHPKRIVMFHGPPANTTTDIVPGFGHVGCMSRRKVIEILKPAIAVVGHIHDTFDSTDTIGKTFIVNPGPIGKLITLSDAPNKPGQEKAKAAAKKTSRKKQP